MRDKIIAVDFDGTITEPSPYPITGAIRPEAIKVLKKLQDRYIILLWTLRTGHDLREALYLLDGVGFHPDYVNMIPGQKQNKPNADIFIDDRNFGFEVDWNKIEKELIGDNENVHAV